MLIQSSAGETRLLHSPPMPRPKPPTALRIRIPSRAQLDPDMRRYFAVCDEKLGFLPNVLAAYSFDQTKLRAFVNLYNELMLGDSGLTRLEREMIAVVVSSANHCYYCLTAHGAAVRQLSGDPVLGEMLVMNWRVAALPPRQRALLQFAHRLTVAPAKVGAADRAALHRAGWSERELWDAAAVTAFFNSTNRLATALDMEPNPEYHAAHRAPRPPPVAAGRGGRPRSALGSPRGHKGR
jgi:uncharacterized peroxidase-related enzyme